MEPGPSYIDPSDFDVVLTDLNYDKLMREVSHELNVQYLSPAEVPDEELEGSLLNGILWGSNSRPLINLVVSSTKYNKPVNIIFIVDTACPYLYLCKDALHALGYTDNIPTQFPIQFRGAVFQGNMSPLVMPDGSDGHFKDVNILGASFLRHARAELVLNYFTLTFSLKTS